MRFSEIVEAAVEDDPQFAAWKLEFDVLRTDKYGTAFEPWTKAHFAFKRGVPPADAFKIWEKEEMLGGL